MGNANSKDMCMWKNVKRSFLFDQQFWRRQIIINSFIDQFLLVPEIFETFHCVAWEKKLLFWAQSSCPSCDCSGWPWCPARLSACWTGPAASSRTGSATSSWSRPSRPRPPCCRAPTWRRRWSCSWCWPTASSWSWRRVTNLHVCYRITLVTGFILLSLKPFSVVTFSECWRKQNRKYNALCVIFLVKSLSVDVTKFDLVSKKGGEGKHARYLCGPCPRIPACV